MLSPSCNSNKNPCAGNLGAAGQYPSETHISDKKDSGEFDFQGENGSGDHEGNLTSGASFISQQRKHC
jgi:hypothetical protein